ncbi:MAG: hypothetical protein Q8T13_05025 [Acidobacteriota bacterium]|nr:hypothetical protein [Acidobacteriota bacterium]
MRTGRTYDTQAAAVADGVPASDVAHLECPLDRVEQRLREGKPVVKFSGGSFKAYRRDEDGQLVRA